MDRTPSRYGRRCPVYGGERIAAAERRAMKIYRGIQQGTAEWFGLRLGIATASRFKDIMTPKTRRLSASWKGYACCLIAERLLNVPTETVEGIKWMERGKELEPD